MDAVPTSASIPSSTFVSPGPPLLVVMAHWRLVSDGEVAMFEPGSEGLDDTCVAFIIGSMPHVNDRRGWVFPGLEAGADALTSRAQETAIPRSFVVQRGALAAVTPGTRSSHEPVPCRQRSLF